MQSSVDVNLEVELSTNVTKTPRVLQCEGMFDVPHASESVTRLQVSLPLSEHAWNIGLIVGPSGAGKSSVLRNVWANNMFTPSWSDHLAVLDEFDSKLGVRDIVEVFSAVGFASPPSWLRPYRALSNGEQFRVALARALLSEQVPVVVDEFTSIVDRIVAKACSGAVAKYARQKDTQLVAASCHYDIVDWLQPDWIYEPVSNDFQWRFLQRRPELVLTVQRVHHSAWEIFRKHHYLSSSLNPTAVCMLASLDGTPVGLSAWIFQPHRSGLRLYRESRIVVLPDYQGFGIGLRLSNLVASAWRGLGFTPSTTTSHPAVIASRTRSPDWELRAKTLLTRPSGMFRAGSSLGKAAALNRLVSSFRYVGPPMETERAAKLLQYC